jgi:HSP20 family molecular chaperone IbpA
MFKRKCGRCGRNIDKNFKYCPNCGNNLKTERDRRDFGFLGRDDNTEDFLGFQNRAFPFGLGSIFNKLVKEIDRQLKEADREFDSFEEDERKFFKKGISINLNSINGKPVIKVKRIGDRENKPVKNEVRTKNLKNINKLPKQEPDANVRRLSNRIIYEINLPGVRDIKDVLINKLENSIEIKAISKDKAYFKLLPVSLPVAGYKLEKERLILELKPKN